MVRCPAVEAAGPSRVVTTEFLLVVFATFAVFATFGIFVLALPLYARDVLGASDLGVGVAVGASSIGAVLAGPPAGRLSDRRGRRVVLIVCAVVLAAGYVALAFEPPLEAIVPIRILAGAGEAGFVVASFTMVTDMAPAARRGEAMSLVTVGSYGGLAVGPVVANFVLDTGGYAPAWLLAAGLAAAAGVAGVVLAETRPQVDGDAPRGWLPPRPALAPGLVILLALLGFGGFNAFAALHAREVGLERPGLVFAVFGGVVVAVRLFGRKLPDRLGARVTASAACIAVAAGLVVVAAWQSPAGLLLGTAVFAAGQALAYPAIVLFAMARSADDERSAAVGAVAAFVDVALASGAFVLGIVADAAGYGAVFLAGAASALLGLVLLARVAARAPAAARA